MLSNRTVEFLNSACKKSNDIYSQGGLMYLYNFGYNRAHSFIERSQLALAKSNNFQREFDELDIKYLGRLFSVATGEDVGVFIGKLVGYLYDDLPNMYCFVDYDEDDYTSIYLAIHFVKDNSFHSLEFDWGVD